MEKYSSGLVAESFWFVEFKKFLKLLSEGKTWNDIKSMCLEDNLLGISLVQKAYEKQLDFLYHLPVGIPRSLLGRLSKSRTDSYKSGK